MGSECWSTRVEVEFESWSLADTAKGSKRGPKSGRIELEAVCLSVADEGGTGSWERSETVRWNDQRSLEAKDQTSTLIRGWPSRRLWGSAGLGEICCVRKWDFRGQECSERENLAVSTGCKGGRVEIMSTLHSRQKDDRDRRTVRSAPHAQHLSALACEGTNRLPQAPVAWTFSSVLQAKALVYLLSIRSEFPTWTCCGSASFRPKFLRSLPPIHLTRSISSKHLDHSRSAKAMGDARVSDLAMSVG